MAYVRKQLLHSKRVQTMKTAILAFCLIATLTLVGCASKPQTFGDQLSNRGEQASSIGKQWNSSNQGALKAKR